MTEGSMRSTSHTGSGPPVSRSSAPILPVVWALAAFSVRAAPELAAIPFRAVVAIATTAAVLFGLRSYSVRARGNDPRTAAGIG
jgi:hypothetical protein